MKKILILLFFSVALTIGSSNVLASTPAYGDSYGGSVKHSSGGDNYSSQSEVDNYSSQSDSNERNIVFGIIVAVGVAIVILCTAERSTKKPLDKEERLKHDQPSNPNTNGYRRWD